MLAYALLSGCAVLDTMLSQESKEYLAQGDELEPAKGYYLWRAPDDVVHDFDYVRAVK